MNQKSCVIISMKNKYVNDNDIKEIKDYYTNLVKNDNIYCFYIQNQDILSQTILGSISNKININYYNYCGNDKDIYLNLAKGVNCKKVILVGMEGNYEIEYRVFFSRKQIDVACLCAKSISNAFFFE